MSLKSIFYEPAHCADFQQLLDAPATFPQLRHKTVIDFQYFVSSMKNMKNIHLINQISYKFEC